MVDITKLKTNQLIEGKINYIIYTKKDKNGPVGDLTFVEMEVKKEKGGTFKISQKWSEKDTLSHIAETDLSPNLKTIRHSTWWKRNGYTMQFDFINQKAEIIGEVSEKIKADLEKNFKASLLTDNFINWHCDLHFFGLLPYSEGSIFKVLVYDPGYSVPKYEVYQVKSSENIQGLDCWVLEYTLPRNMGFQRFWISKKDRIVVKEEDSFRGAYRFKLKTLLAE
jgi:hypothetical protein